MRATKLFIGAASVGIAGYHAIAVLGKTESYAAACGALLVALSMWFLGFAAAMAPEDAR